MTLKCVFNDFCLRFIAYISIFQHLVVLDLLRQNHWKNLLKIKVLGPNLYLLNQNLRKIFLSNF